MAQAIQREDEYDNHYTVWTADGVASDGRTFYAWEPTESEADRKVAEQIAAWEDHLRGTPIQQLKNLVNADGGISSDDVGRCLKLIARILEGLTLRNKKLGDKHA